MEVVRFPRVREALITRHVKSVITMEGLGTSLDQTIINSMEDVIAKSFYVCGSNKRSQCTSD